MGKPWQLPLDEKLSPIPLTTRLLSPISLTTRLPSQLNLKCCFALHSRFREELGIFDEMELPESTLDVVEPYLKKPHFVGDYLEKKTNNPAVGSLVLWVRGVVKWVESSVVPLDFTQCLVLMCESIPKHHPSPRACETAGASHGLTLCAADHQTILLSVREEMASAAKVRHSCRVLKTEMAA